MNRIMNVFAVIVVALCLASVASAEWAQTPFGRVWIGPGPAPAQTEVPKPAELPKPAPFTPTYEDLRVTDHLNGKTYSLNPWYAASKETAEEVCRRFFCAVIAEKPIIDAAPGSPFQFPFVRILVWPDSLEVNAGLLASYYTRNPEDQFPNVAERFVSAILDALRKK